MQIPGNPFSREDAVVRFSNSLRYTGSKSRLPPRPNPGQNPRAGQRKYVPMPLLPLPRKNYISPLEGALIGVIVILGTIGVYLAYQVFKSYSE
ncbi:hypothetical protein FJZ17_01660 [Candidatus Pacearchaeota archaeon]|nr:hypothetical protein [Candidatus Pacearchaeota archaeon]